MACDNDDSSPHRDSSQILIRTHHKGGAFATSRSIATNASDVPLNSQAEAKNCPALPICASEATSSAARERTPSLTQAENQENDTDSDSRDWGFFHATCAQEKLKRLCEPWGWVQRTWFSRLALFFVFGFLMNWFLKSFPVESFILFWISIVVVVLFFGFRLAVTVGT
eukprot:m.153185 g.153185  ORF g.153185 m.153185 type:complete len:168 (-) comp24578_c0_seq4:94-597(-)